MLLRIKQIAAIKPFSIHCIWTDGVERVIDFTKIELYMSSTFFKQCILVENIFTQAKLDTVAKTIYWENVLPQLMADGSTTYGNLDLCPDTLRMYSV
jgi:hypothetical protein